MYFWWIPPGSLDASWVSFWCLDMEVPCQVNRFTQPLSPEEWFQVSTLGQIWMELNHQERHIHYSSCIDHIFNHIGVHIFIIPSSIFNINQTTSSGKEAVNRKKKQVAFSTIALQQISCNRSSPSHGSRFQWSSKLCWMLEGMACSYKILDILEVWEVPYISQLNKFFWWFLLTLPDFIIFHLKNENKARCSCRFIPCFDHHRCLPFS